MIDDDTGLPIPHRCGAVCDFCILSKGYKILFCDICKKVVGYEKNGIRYIRNFKEREFRKNQYSKETLNDSV